MRILHTLIFILLIGGFISCQESPQGSTVRYDVGLTELKKIVLPVDENTYYLSKSMFQFEEDDKEYLQFGNFEKRQHEILIYDIENFIYSTNFSVVTHFSCKQTLNI
jgi:hypothetical protein